MGVVREPQQQKPPAPVKNFLPTVFARISHNDTNNGAAASSSRSFMQFLPPEIFSIFASYIFLTPQSLLNLELCCKSWRTSVYEHYLWPLVARRLLHEQLFCCDDYSLQIIAACEPPKQIQQEPQKSTTSPITTSPSSISSSFFVSHDSKQIQTLKQMLSKLQGLKRRHLITPDEMRLLLSNVRNRPRTQDELKINLPHNYLRVAIVGDSTNRQVGKQGIAYNFATGGNDPVAAQVMRYEQATKQQHKFYNYNHDYNREYWYAFYEYDNNDNTPYAVHRHLSVNSTILGGVQFGSMLQGRVMHRGTPVAVYFQVVKNVANEHELRCIVRFYA